MIFLFSIPSTHPTPSGLSCDCVPLQAVVYWASGISTTQFYYFVYFIILYPLKLAGSALVRMSALVLFKVVVDDKHLLFLFCLT